MKTTFDEIRENLRELVETGTVKGKIVGPADNVLEVETMEDFCLASGKMVEAGYHVASPGGFGGSAPVSRQATHVKIWKSGTLCAVTFNRRVFFFYGLLFQDEQYVDIPFRS